MLSKSRFLAAAGCIFALTLAACGGAQPNADGGDATTDEAASDTGDATEASDVEPAELRLVLASAAYGAKEEVATYAVADQLGFLEEEQLTIDVRLADGSTAAFQAVASGSGDVTAGSALSLLPAVAEGVPVKAFGGLVQNWPYRIGVPPDSDIESPSDLANTQIGIISLASASNGYTRAVLDLAGLDPDNDAELLAVGAGPTAATALESGEVDALALYGGAYADLEANGLELRYLENEAFFDDLFSITWVTTPDQLAERPDVYERFARAMYKGLLFSAENPEAAMRMGYEVFPDLLPPSGDPEETIEADTATLETWIGSATPTEGEPSSWGDWGDITEDRWSALQSFVVESGSLEQELPLDDVWDGSLIEGINDFDRDEVLQLADEAG